MGEIFERAWPRETLEWTGERLTTASPGQVEIEHLHRYFLARAHCRGLDVLDVASGEGYGSALLAQVARSVVGVELSEQAVAHASQEYAASNLRYQQGDARSLPVGDASVDAVVSFETLEHLFEHERFIAEVRRVLRPGGRLILSSPERDVYSPSGSVANPYHAHELSRGEFEALMRASFSNVQVLLQRPMLGSALVADDGARESQILTFEQRGNNHFEASEGLPRAPYIIAIASDQLLPTVPNSLYIATSEIGDLLSRAAEAKAREDLQYQLEEQLRRANESASGVEADRAERVYRAEQAEAGLVAAREELQRRSEEIAVLSKNFGRKREELQSDLLGTREELRRRSEENAALSKNFGREREELQSDLLGTREELRRRSEEIAALSNNFGREREELQSDLLGTREELRRRSEEIAALSKNFGREREELQSDLEGARAELLTVRHQRDIIRMSFHQRNTIVAQLRGKAVALEAEAAEGEARDRERSALVAELRGKVAALEAEAAEGEARDSERSALVAELRGKVAALEAEAAEGEARYQALRARLVAILRRFGVLRIAPLVPRSLRRFVRERMLGAEPPK